MEAIPVTLRATAVIPNWNGLRHLQKLFGSLQAQTRPFDQVIVVDNGSTDASVSFCRQLQAEVIELGSNQGFAPAVNAGVRHAVNASHVAVLNNDVELRPDWLKCILDNVGPAAGACGKVLSTRNPSRIDATWDALSLAGTALRCGSGEPDGRGWSQPGVVTFVPFTAALIRRDVFLTIGGLDEDFVTFLEDVDFGLRCGSKGHTFTYVPRAICLHEGSATAGVWSARSVRQISRNQVLLVAKHYSPQMLRDFGWKIAVGQALWGLLAARHGQFMAWLGGKQEGYRIARRCRERVMSAGSGEELRRILTSSEREIETIQSRTSGRNLYWRLYFLLT